MTSSPVLIQLAKTAAGCQNCQLAQHRTQVVFGTGDHTAQLMLIGEAPGYYEDQQGEPFVGRAGKLLDRLLSEIELDRTQVYITNVVKCRPPQNRDPQPEEIDACKHFLDAQLSEVDPGVVVTLGNFATKLLLGTKTGITRLRGQPQQWRNKTLIPTFHPAAVLRQGQTAMTQIQEDFRLVRYTLNQILLDQSRQSNQHRSADNQPTEPGGSTNKPSSPATNQLHSNPAEDPPPTDRQTALF